MSPAFKRRARGGAQALELALIMPVMLAFLLGIIEFSWFFNQNLQLHDLTRQAARDASMAVDASDSEMTERVAAFVQEARLDQGKSGEVDVVVESTGEAPTQVVAVTLTEVHVPLTGYVPLPSTVSARLSLRRETQL